jgi:hypothetical protein
MFNPNNSAPKNAEIQIMSLKTTYCMKYIMGEVRYRQVQQTVIKGTLNNTAGDQPKGPVTVVKLPQK